MTAKGSVRSMVLGLGVVFVIVFGSSTASPQSPPFPDAELGKRRAVENRSLPEHEAFFWQAIKESDRFIQPLLEECAVQDCFGAGMSNEYLVRIRADGTIADVFIEPPNRFTACVASGLKARARLTTVPPKDDYWMDWAASGIMRVPEACREELLPPAWHTVKWWLFMGNLAFPRAAVRVKGLFVGIALVPFLLAIGAWKLLRPGAVAGTVVRRLATGAVLVLLAAACSFLTGVFAKETRDENRENALITVIVTFPLLAAAPFAWDGLRGPRQLPRGARVRVPTVGRVRRAFGLVVLVTALLPAAAMAWFGVHENIYRLCPSCVKPMKFSWLRL